MPKCVCGKGVQFWSTALQQGFCSDECYDKARANPSKDTKLTYQGHGKYT